MGRIPPFIKGDSDELSSSILKKYRERILAIDFNNYFTALLNGDIPIGNSYFGDWSITLFMAREFYIEVIFWRTSWTGIHEHGFSGAFLNLKGERLIGNYKFQEGGEKIDNKIKKGILKKEKIECMKKGEVRTIVKGIDGIHRTICVEELGLSLVVRTEQEQLSQLHFFSNGMALCSWQAPRDKIKKICSFLQICRNDSLSTMLEEIYEKLTLYEFLHFLTNCFDYIKTEDEYCQMKSFLSKKKYGNEFQEILTELRFERNLRYKISLSPPYDIRKELVSMVLNYCM